MHELTLCYQTYEMVEQKAKAMGAKRINAIWLEIGALSCVEIEAINFCFELVCKDTMAENCKIHIHQQPAKAWCDKCQQKVAINNVFIPICKLCGNSDIIVDADDKVWVKKIQVD
ncbi:hydrogenase maturation nickel metallochaperone HypA [Orbus wheelerorum]|uniref:hydrogenase maturation nickel metallochaperone HypA n=1 Tax=Orbus wheelerorum TaxID=3074111 RepID=UPI00370D8AB4